MIINNFLNHYFYSFQCESIIIKIGHNPEVIYYIYLFYEFQEYRTMVEVNRVVFQY